MRVGTLLWLSEQPVCTALIADQLCECPLDKLPPHRGPLVVLLPSTQVVLAQATLPGLSRHRLLQAVPYSLEEQCAEDVEDLHFALGEQQRDGSLPVAVISHTLMQRVLARLHQAGLKPTWMIPDVLAVPYPADGWSILIIGGVALVRTGAQQGFAIEPTLLPALLSPLLRSQAASDHLPARLWLYKGVRTEAAVLQTILDGYGIPLEEKSQEQGSLRLFATHLAHAHKTAAPINLMQGDYRPRNPITLLWRPWRLTAILLGIWLGLQGLAQFQQVQTLRQQRDALSTELTEIYRRSFPEARKIIEPRLQMERQLASLRQQAGASAQGTGFLALISAMTKPLADTPGLLLTRLDYRQGMLDVALELPDLQALERLRQALSQQRLNVEIRSAVSRQQRVDAQLRLKE